MSNHSAGWKEVSIELKRRCDELEAENKRLRAEVNRLPDDAELDDLRGERDGLQESLEQERKAYQATQDQLQEEVRKLRSQLGARDMKIELLSERRNDLAEQLKEVKAEVRELKAWERRRRSPPRNQGRPGNGTGNQ